MMAKCIPCPPGRSRRGAITTLSQHSEPFYASEVKRQYFLTNIDILLKREIKVRESYCLSRKYVSSGYTVCLNTKSCDKHGITNAFSYLTCDQALIISVLARVFLRPQESTRP